MWLCHLCETRFQERSLEINGLPFPSGKHEDNSASNVISILNKSARVKESVWMFYMSSFFLKGAELS